MKKPNKSKHDMELINIMYDEWKFRLTQYWSVTSKTFMLILFLFFIPYLKDTWGINNINLPNYIFPIVGIFFSISDCILVHFEMMKINKIKDSINKYVGHNSKNFINPYKGIVGHLNLHIFICAIQVIVGFIVLLTVI